MRGWAAAATPAGSAPVACRAKGGEGWLLSACARACTGRSSRHPWRVLPRALAQQACGSPTPTACTCMQRTMQHGTMRALHGSITFCLPCLPWPQFEDPAGNVVFERHGESEGAFHFTTTAEGEYKLCFTAKGGRLVPPPVAGWGSKYRC